MSDPENLVQSIDDLSARLSAAKTAINTRFIGQTRVVDQVLTAVFAGGHAVLIGVPGLGKTRLVSTLGHVLGLNTSRIQFTPDLMPSDILGSEVLEGPDTARSFRFIPGPIFCELLMADEINRASPRTQSALLQAMQEKQVTTAGQTRDLGAPFLVLATQNPLEQEGTYPLPEAQLDRFLLRIDVGYPDLDTERNIVLATTGLSDDLPDPVFSPADIVAAQRLLAQVPVGQGLMDFVLRLVRACRPGTADAHPLANQHLSWGPGPRASQAFVLAVRAHAVIRGVSAPTMRDVVDLAPAVLSHRMSLKFSAQAAGVSMADVIAQIVADLDAQGQAA